MVGSVAPQVGNPPPASGKCLGFEVQPLIANNTVYHTPGENIKDRWESSHFCVNAPHISFQSGTYKHGSKYHVGRFFAVAMLPDCFFISSRCWIGCDDRAGSDRATTDHRRGGGLQTHRTASPSRHDLAWVGQNGLGSCKNDPCCDRGCISGQKYS